MDDDDDMETVDDVYEINDIRSQTEFRGITLSDFKKSDALKQLLENIKKSKIESACYWSAELVCAGHYHDLWELYINYISKYIHLGNPKIAIYLENRYNIFRNIMSQGKFLTELHVRNHPNIRKIFAEITCTLCLSEKKIVLNLSKLKNKKNLTLHRFLKN